jgi:hypothetical protein
MGRGCAHIRWWGRKFCNFSVVLETNEEQQEQQRTIPAGSQNWATTQISCACGRRLMAARSESGYPKRVIAAGSAPLKGWTKCHSFLQCVAGLRCPKLHSPEFLSI